MERKQKRANEEYIKRVQEAHANDNKTAQDAVTDNSMVVPKPNQVANSNDEIEMGANTKVEGEN